MKSELLAREELAARFAVDVRTVTNWVADGMPQRSKSGRVRYAWLECLEWREKKIREDARATREVGGDPDKKEQMAEYRLREARAAAEKAEYEVEQLRASLVTLDYMENEFAHMTGELRAKLLSVPASWAGRLMGCQTEIDMQIALGDAVNELLPLLGAAADDDADHDDESPRDDVEPIEDTA